MIQLGRRGGAVTASAEEIEAARETFATRHHLILPALIEPSVLTEIQDRIERSEFRTKVHSDIGVELCLKDDVAIDELCFLTNDPRLLRFVEDVTRCSRIGCFLGRVYRVVPGEQHHDDFHDDLIEDRLVGMSINLSRAPFRGGELIMRRFETHEPVACVSNTGPGDALLFRLALGFEHRIGDIEGDEPKTAYAGWFKSKPEFVDLLTHKAGWVAS